MSKKDESVRGLSFVKRVYPARTLGLGLGGVAVGTVLLAQDFPVFYWLLLLVNGLVWPHLAYVIACRSAIPFQAERRHLLLDSGSGGFWVVAMGFNPLVSTLILMMLWMNNIAAGGLRLFLKGLATTGIGLLVGLAAFGWHPDLTTGDWVVYASLPMLVAYPVAIGLITYNLAIQLHQQKELLKRLSRTDGLTGLYNRYYWESRTTESIAVARRNNQPMALILLDIDHFKAINDTYGHVAGDQVLKQVAQLLRMNLREGELLGRYGGEEFALLLPNTTQDAAYATAERLRLLVGQALYEIDERVSGLRCSISVGVAAFREGQGYSEWFRAADAALYQAKHIGRNTTVVFDSTLQDVLVLHKHPGDQRATSPV
ncbi:diguanylate cyclase [Cellvibrio sp. pealriver]|uniref:diguanylate cyclase n=1 Tax=Cellvibrio sp. pealriver TaxID=1622269 RepID=UPI00066FF098|nr:diguanylate cyclase [Cellvibrio sp. pealriver]